MQWHDYLLLALLAIQVVGLVASLVRLRKYRENYPIKQLSPKVTGVLTVACVLVSLQLVIVQLAYPGEKPPRDSLVVICNMFYVFFRQLVVFGFYLRCLRICVAYYKQLSCRPIIAIFSSERLIILLAVIFSLSLPIVLLIENSAFEKVPLSEFFHFFSKTGAKRPFVYALWVVDNGLFFLVMGLSMKVTSKFRFINSLIAAFLLIKLQNWYKLVWLAMDENSPARIDMENRFYFVPIIAHVFCMVVLIEPTFKATYELPLPNEVIITNHNMLFQYAEAYTILYQFARHLENSNQYSQENEKRMHACRYLQVYSELIIARRTIARCNVQKSTIDIEPEVTREFIQKFVIPNFEELQLLQSTTKQLFTNGKPEKASIKEGLTMSELAPLNNKLLRVMNYIYGEWRHTFSMLALRKELQGNTPIITKMVELQISLT